MEPGSYSIVPGRFAARPEQSCNAGIIGNITLKHRTLGRPKNHRPTSFCSTANNFKMMQISHFLPLYKVCKFCYSTRIDLTPALRIEPGTRPAVRLPAGDHKIEEDQAARLQPPADLPALPMTASRRVMATVPRTASLAPALAPLLRRPPRSA